MTEWQEKAANNYLSTSMKSYILWLENQLDTKEKQAVFISDIKILFEVYREMVRERLRKEEIYFHDRTPEGVAFLLVAFEYFTCFLLENNSINKEENTKLGEEMLVICIELCKAQSESLHEVSISEKFVGMILVMMENEIIRVVPKESFVSCQNDCIGFSDDDFYYLNMTATLKHVRKFCLEQGEPMPPSVNILLKHLDEDDILLLNSNGGRTHSVRISSTKNLRVAIFTKDKFDKTESVT